VGVDGRLTGPFSFFHYGSGACPGREEEFRKIIPVKSC
jgi:hypothetical protein